MKLIIMTDKIEKAILELYDRWKGLEKTSKRSDRCTKQFFKDKEEKFKEHLDMPMDISKTKPEQILKNCKIIDWKEDLEHFEAAAF